MTTELERNGRKCSESNTAPSTGLEVSLNLKLKLQNSDFD